MQNEKILFFTPSVEVWRTDGRISSLLQQLSCICDGKDILLAGTCSGRAGLPKQKFNTFSFSKYDVFGWLGILRHIHKSSALFVRPFGNESAANKLLIRAFYGCAKLFGKKMYLLLWGGPRDAIFCTENSDGVVVIGQAYAKHFTNARVWNQIVPRAKNNLHKPGRPLKILFMTGANSFTAANEKYILEERGLAFLLRYLHENGAKNARLIFAAPFINKMNYKERFVRLLKSQGCYEQVTLKGEIKNKKKVFEDVDVYCLIFKRMVVSWMPFSIIEALENGCAFITSKTRITEEYFKNNESMLVEPKYENVKAALDLISKGKMSVVNEKRFDCINCRRQFEEILNET